MGTLTIRLKKLRRKKQHLRYLQNSIWTLKYEILNDALAMQVNKNKVNLFHKYQKRYRLITFFK